MQHRVLDRTVDSGTRGVELAAAPRTDGSLGGALRAVWSDLREVVHEHAVLAVLEAQRAGLHLAFVVAAVLVGSVLVVTAWLAVVTAIAMWLLRSDVPWPGVLLVAALLNLIAAALVGWWAKRQVTELPFSATLRQLSADRREINASGNHAPTA